MPQISACIGSMDVALASMAKWPTSCTRAIQALRSASVRTVWYLLRSTGVFRAASARAAARARGVRGISFVWVCPLPAFCMFPPPLWEGGEPEAPRSCGPPPRSSRGQALPRKGGGSKEVVAAVRWCIRTCIDAGARAATAVLPIRLHIRRIDLRILRDPPGQGGKFHRLQKRDQLACVGLVHREFVERHVELDLVVEQHQLPRDPRLFGF